MARYLYHWTTTLALDSIADAGLDPEYAQGRRKVVWMADESMAMWAACHAAHHQCVSPSEMVCIRVRVDGLRMVRTRWQGVYTVGTVVAASRLTRVSLTLRPAGRVRPQGRRRV